MKETIKETEKILKALANRRRLAIIKYLNKTKTASVGDISEEIKLSFKATSKHLSVLYSADIVEREQVGMTMIYKLSNPLHSVLKLIISFI